MFRGSRFRRRGRQRDRKPRAFESLEYTGDEGGRAANLSRTPGVRWLAGLIPFRLITFRLRVHWPRVSRVFRFIIVWFNRRKAGFRSLAVQIVFSYTS